jgi:hypothetical protein
MEGTLNVPEPIGVVHKMETAFANFKAQFSGILTTAASETTAAAPTAKPPFSRLSEMMDTALTAIKPFFPKLQQPKFVVTDCGTNQQMQMWYCVPTSMEIPETLLFQQSAAQKMTETQKHFWHRISSFADAEWYVVPVLCLWLRQKGYKIDCCAVESKVMELLPVLRMQTGTYKKNGQALANTRDVLMSGFVEKATGKRSALSVQFKVGRSRTPAVDMMAVYACEGKEEDWNRLCTGTRTGTGNRPAFVPATLKKTKDTVDAGLQLFLMYRQLEMQSPDTARQFMDAVVAVCST